MKQIGNWKNKLKRSQPKLACSKASALSLTDPVCEMNWLSSKVQSSNSLEISKFSQTDPVFEMNWNTSKLHKSNSWLKKKTNCLRFESVYK